LQEHRGSPDHDDRNGRKQTKLAPPMGARFAAFIVLFGGCPELFGTQNVHEAQETFFPIPAGAI
jgi:hypothetical protein